MLPFGSTPKALGCLLTYPRPSGLFRSASSGFWEPRSSVRPPCRFSHGAPTAAAWDSPARPRGCSAGGRMSTGKGAGCGEARKCPLLAWFLPSLFSHSQTSPWLVISAHLSPSSAPRNSLLYPRPCLVPAGFSWLTDPPWVPSNTRTRARSVPHSKSTGRNGHGD